MKKILNFLKTTEIVFPYNCIGLGLIFLHIAFKRKNKFVCSQFVGHIMEKSGINLDIPKPVCLHTPEDFRHIKSAQLIYKGDLNKFHISEEYNSVNFMENQSVRTA